MVGLNGNADAHVDASKLRQEWVSVTRSYSLTRDKHNCLH